MPSLSSIGETQAAEGRTIEVSPIRPAVAVSTAHDAPIAPVNWGILKGEAALRTWSALGTIVLLGRESPLSALFVTFSRERESKRQGAGYSRILRKESLFVKTVTLYTDGACSGNPGPGGWGAILMLGEHKKELSGGEANTTNNRMELTAVIRGLEALKEPCLVDLYSDSKYVIDALEKGWARGWKARGWIKSDKKPALNPDLWERLLALCETHTVKLHWVKGHADNPYNNRCDQLAVGEWQKLK